MYKKATLIPLHHALLLLYTYSTSIIAKSTWTSSTSGPVPSLSIPPITGQVDLFTSSSSANHTIKLASQNSVSDRIISTPLSPLGNRIPTKETNTHLHNDNDTIEPILSLESIAAAISNNLNNLNNNSINITQLISADYLKKKGSDWVNNNMNMNVTQLLSSDFYIQKGIDIFDMKQEPVVLLRGGDLRKLLNVPMSRKSLKINVHNRLDQNTITQNKMDQIGKSICQVAFLKILFDTIAQMLTVHNFTLFDEIASKVLSTETHAAVKTIRDILTKFPDHGIIDIFKDYPRRDVILSFVAFSRLQRFSVHYKEFYLSSIQQSSNLDNNGTIRKRNSERIIASMTRKKTKNQRISYINKGSIVSDEQLLNDLAHYSVFANAAYGWKMRLLLSGKLHTGNKKVLIERTGVEEENIVEANWKAKTHLPAHFIVRDVKRKNIVLCIRGTLSPRDVLTDLCCIADDFISKDVIDSFRDKNTALFKKKFLGRAHQGMLQSARGIEAAARTKIAKEFASHPDYNLVIVGHSLGGGVAAILGTMWKKTFPGRTVYAYGCPCVGPIDTNPTNDPSIISVVGEGDPFSTLSLGHLADTSRALSQLCEDEALRSDVLLKTQGDIKDTSKEDLQWCYDTMQKIRIKMKGEKFYPPGRILYMGGAVFGNKDGEVTLKEVSTETFEELLLHPFMFDLSRHVPNRYEYALQKLYASNEQIQKSKEALQ